MCKAFLIFFSIISQALGSIFIALNYDTPTIGSLVSVDTRGHILKTSLLENDNTSTAMNVDCIGNQVVVCGASGSSNLYAKAWVLDSKGNLLNAVPLEQDSKPSQAIALSSLGQRVFICGNQSQGLDSTATLWIIDLKGNFISSTSLAVNQQRSLVSSICVSNQKIYISGARSIGTESVAQLWITDKNGVVLKQKTLASPEEFSLTTKVIAVGDNLYITGIHRFKPYLWVLDLEGNIVHQTYLSNSYEGETIDVYPLHNTLVLCGHVLKENSTAFCWIVDPSGRLIQTIELENNNPSKAYSLTALGNRVCISGYAKKNGQSLTTLWLVDTKNSFQKTVNLGPGFYKEDSSTQIRAHRNLLFLTGNIMQNNEAKAWLYVLDPYGNLLNSTCLAENAFYSIPEAISSIDSGLLIKAQRAFSPIVEQKGQRR